MINKHSIFFFITVFFILAFFSIVGFFSLLISLDISRQNTEYKERLSATVRTLKHFLAGDISGFILKEQLHSYKIKLIGQDKISFLEDVKNYKTFEYDKNVFHIYMFAGQSYVSVITGDGKNIFFFEDTKGKDNKNILIFFVEMLAVILMLVFSYFLVIEKLKPIKILKNDIKKLNKNKQINFKVLEGKDEISEFANMFYSALKNLASLRMSRDFFIRNMMHELKTPITKGKIATTILEESKNKIRLQNVFARMELLVNEFSSVEKMIAGIYQDEQKIYRIVDLIDGAKDLLIDPSNVTVGSIEGSIRCNYNLFTIAFKNLMDNAIKYSPDKSVTIKQEKNILEFINNGEKMKKSLQEYSKAFEKDSQDGLGLGLYIVTTTLENYDLKLEYKYEKENIFYIDFGSKI